MLKSLLAHPLSKGLAVDDPKTTLVRREIIRRKPFLRGIYDEWYRTIASRIPEGPGGVLELGSGAGFLEHHMPGVITSEVFFCPGIRLVLDGLALPFARHSLKAIVMTDVFHHLPDVRKFFAEARRCLRRGGAIVMIEPWVTSWSSVVYRSLHHEPFRPDATDWKFPSTGPLSGANGALPWIVFQRDRALFEKEWPEWRIERVELMMPFRYLVSGGVSMRSLMPGWTLGFWRGVESALRPFSRQLAMFALVVLGKSAGDGEGQSETAG